MCQFFRVYSFLASSYVDISNEPLQAWRKKLFYKNGEIKTCEKFCGHECTTDFYFIFDLTRANREGFHIFRYPSKLKYLIDMYFFFFSFNKICCNPKSMSYIVRYNGSQLISTSILTINKNHITSKRNNILLRIWKNQIMNVTLFWFLNYKQNQNNRNSSSTHTQEYKQ